MSVLGSLGSRKIQTLSLTKKAQGILHLLSQSTQVAWEAGPTSPYFLRP